MFKSLGGLLQFLKRLNNKNYFILQICLFISTAVIITKFFPLYPDLNRVEFLLPCLVLGIINYVVFNNKWYLVINNCLLSSFLAIILKINKLINLNNIIFTILSWSTIIFIVYVISFFINE